MKNLLSASVLALTLGACGNSASDTPFSPGQWEVAAGPSKFEVPGASAEQQAAFESMMGDTATQEQCLTQAEAERGLEPLAEAFSQNGDCKVAKFNAVDGKVDGVMTCTIDGVEEPTETVISGSYSEEKFDMDVVLDLSQPQFPEGKASMTVSISGKRLGDCDSY